MSTITLIGGTGATGCTGALGITGPTGVTGATGTFSGVIYQNVVPAYDSSYSLGDPSHNFAGLYVNALTVTLNNLVINSPTTGNFNINANTLIYGTADSTSTATGALQVTGGVGIKSNLVVGGNVGIGGTSSNYALDVSGGFNLTNRDASGNLNCFVMFPTTTLSAVNFGDATFPTCKNYYPFDTDVSNYATGTPVLDASFVGTGCSRTTIGAKIGGGCIVQTINNVINAATGSFSFATPSAQIPANVNGYSFACWFNLTSATSGMLFTMNATYASTNSRIFIYNSSGTIQIGTTSSGGTNTTANVFTPALNTWYHLAWTLSPPGSSTGTVSKFYVNGAQIHTSTAITYLSSAYNSARLLADSSGNGVLGYLDDFRYYDGILTASQVNNIYTYTGSLNQSIGPNKEGIWYNVDASNNVYYLQSESSGNYLNTTLNLNPYGGNVSVPNNLSVGGSIIYNSTNTSVGYGSLTGLYNTGLGYNAGTNNIPSSITLTALTSPGNATGTVSNVLAYSINATATRAVAACATATTVTYYVSNNVGTSFASFDTYSYANAGANMAGAAISQDGSMAIIAVPGSGIFRYTWNGVSTFTNKVIDSSNVGLALQQVKLSLDNSRIIASVNSGRIYYALWNGSSFNQLATTLDTGTYAAFIAIAPSNNFIVYSDSNVTNGPVYISYWNGSNYMAPTFVTNVATGVNTRGLTFSPDGMALYSYTQSNGFYYSLWNGYSFGTFTSSAALPSGNCWGLCTDMSGNIYSTITTGASAINKASAVINYGKISSNLCTFLGANTSANGLGYYQSTAIGHGATITGSNQIVLGTASEVITMPNKLGIGTTNPTATLDVRGSSLTTGLLQANDLGNYPIFLQSQSSSSRSEIKFAGTGSAHWSIFNNSGTFQINQTSTSINMGTIGTNVVSINSNNYFGIGTPNPQYLLDVSSSASSAAIAKIGGINGFYFMQNGQSVGYGCYYNAAWFNGSNSTSNTYSSYWGFAPSSGTLNYNVTNAASASGTNINSALTTPFTITSSGYVGIGTSPGTPLHVYTSSTSSLNLVRFNDPNTSLDFVMSSKAGTGATTGWVALDPNGGGNTGVSVWDAFYVQGTFGASGTKSFDIQHPSIPSKRLIHSSIEGPRIDLIYRGSVQLNQGKASINLDKDCVENPECAMTEGTFVLLCRNAQYSLQNHTSFSRVRGNIEGNILSIICEDSNSTDTIYWTVIAERQDKDIYQCKRTNIDGHLITEYEE